MDNYLIGIMTGTSADSLDGCIVNFEKNVDLIETAQVDLGTEYKDKYEECIRLGFKEVGESSELLEVEKNLNEKTVELVEALINKSGISSKSISLIAFSGQTVFHTYDKSYQIGNSQKIADMTGINVCSNFRNYDINQGGMGAPLIPAFHKYLYAEKNKNKLIFNIGGISNGTYLMGTQIEIASDVGPGNCLIDMFVKKYFNLPYDFDGKIASDGDINDILINKLLLDTKNMTYPRADDKNDYYKLIDENFLGVAPKDIIRTLTEFTAIKIKDFYDYCECPSEIIFHGGGAKNSYLMEVISKNLNSNIRTTDSEIDSKFVEATAFAYLAYLERGEIYFSK
tara:strand:- start:2064 stop:3083 length:1020 start_codon:yes stop_codon:yes gene_type:complete